MIPKYMQVYTEIGDATQKGSHSTSEILSSGEEFAKQYACSVLAVRKALGCLVSKGVIVGKRGLRSFVKKYRTGPDRMQGVAVTGRDLIREKVTSVVEKFEVAVYTTELTDKMNIQAGELVYEIKRTHLHKRKPGVIEYTWMLLQIIPGLQRRNVKTSIYACIKKQFHRHMQGAHLLFQAVRPQALEEKYFHMNDNDFICQVEELTYLDTSEIFEYSVARHLPQYLHFETNVIKELYDN